MTRCVFCDREHKSREHVIPQWLGEPLKDSHPVAPGKHRIGLTHRYTPPAGREAEAREWSMAGPDLVTTEVCGQCNNGWLAELESRVKPTLEKLVRGEPADVLSDDQPAMATWCYKTVLLMQLVRPGKFRFIPRERYSQLRHDGRPPSDVRLWLGSTPVDGLVVHEATMGASLSTLSSKHPGYFSVLTVGHLVILCSGRCHPSAEPLSFDAHTEGKAVLRLWPGSIRTAQWPPVEVIHDLGLEALGALI